MAALLILEMLCVVPIAWNGKTFEANGIPLVLLNDIFHPCGDPGKISISGDGFVENIHIRKFNTHSYQHVTARGNISLGKAGHSHICDQHSAFKRTVRGKGCSWRFRPGIPEAALSSLISAEILNCWAPNEISRGRLPAIFGAYRNQRKCFTRNKVITKSHRGFVNINIGSDLSFADAPGFNNCIFGSESGAFGRAQREANEDYPKKSDRRFADTNPEHFSSPVSHLLLGIEILLKSVFFFAAIFVGVLSFERLGDALYVTFYDGDKRHWRLSLWFAIALIGIAGSMAVFASWLSGCSYCH